MAFPVVGDGVGDGPYHGLVDTFELVDVLYLLMDHFSILKDL